MTLKRKHILLSTLVVALVVAVLYFSNTFAYYQGDTQAPILSNGLPAANLPSGTTSTTLGVTTDEMATCMYSTTPGTSFDAMTDSMVTDDGVTQTAPLSGLTDGTTYNYYIRCIDTSSNSNAEDFVVTFAVELPGATAYTVAGPARGIADRASTAFSVSPNNIFTGTITAHYVGAGLDGSSDIVFSGTSTPETFTITPTTSGEVTLTFTNSGALSNPASLSYRALSGAVSGSSATSSFTAPSTKPTPQNPNPSPEKHVDQKVLFTKNLSSGMIDDEVQMLQQYLNAHGYTINTTGPGSSGNETTKFGRATLRALIKFQLANHLAPATGNFGPATRALINASL